MTEQDDISLGTNLGAYIIATMIADGCNTDPALWQKMQTTLVDKIAQQTGLAAEDIMLLLSDQISRARERLASL